jgi:hypothetical protein
LRQKKLATSLELKILERNPSLKFNNNIKNLRGLKDFIYNNSIEMEVKPTTKCTLCYYRKMGGR